MNKFYLLIFPLLVLLNSCAPLNDNEDFLVADPVSNVFHDIEELEVADSLTQLALNVKILGWERNERSRYMLHYQLINGLTSIRN